MGKQINYYMDYESFLQLAQTALDAGCLILKGVYTEEKQNPCEDISVITPDCNRYYFYLPELGNVAYKIDSRGLYYIDFGYNQTGQTLIDTVS